MKGEGIEPSLSPSGIVPVNRFERFARVVPRRSPCRYLSLFWWTRRDSNPISLIASQVHSQLCYRPICWRGRLELNQSKMVCCTYLEQDRAVYQRLRVFPVVLGGPRRNRAFSSSMSRKCSTIRLWDLNRCLLWSLDSNQSIPD